MSAKVKLRELADFELIKQAFTYGDDNFTNTACT